LGQPNTFALRLRHEGAEKRFAISYQRYSGFGGTVAPDLELASSSSGPYDVEFDGDQFAVLYTQPGGMRLVRVNQQGLLTTGPVLIGPIFGENEARGKIVATGTEYGVLYRHPDAGEGRTPVSGTTGQSRR
jgi:hypothetical protein